MSKTLTMMPKKATLTAVMKTRAYVKSRMTDLGSEVSAMAVTSGSGSRVQLGEGRAARAALYYDYEEFARLCVPISTLRTSQRCIAACAWNNAWFRVFPRTHFHPAKTARRQALT